MKLSEFIDSCSNYQYSKEYLELLKESYECEFMEAKLNYINFNEGINDAIKDKYDKVANKKVTITDKITAGIMKIFQFFITAFAKLAGKFNETTKQAAKLVQFFSSYQANQQDYDKYLEICNKAQKEAKEGRDTYFQPINGQPFKFSVNFQNVNGNKQNVISQYFAAGLSNTEALCSGRFHRETDGKNTNIVGALPSKLLINQTYDLVVNKHVNIFDVVKKLKEEAKNLREEGKGLLIPANSKELGSYNDRLVKIYQEMKTIQQKTEGKSSPKQESTFFEVLDMILEEGENNKNTNTQSSQTSQQGDTTNTTNNNSNTIQNNNHSNVNLNNSGSNTNANRMDGTIITNKAVKQKYDISGNESNQSPSELTDLYAGFQAVIADTMKLNTSYMIFREQIITQLYQYHNIGGNK